MIQLIQKMLIKIKKRKNVLVCFMDTDIQFEKNFIYFMDSIL